jgi:hypothetical protein
MLVFSDACPHALSSFPSVMTQRIKPQITHAPAGFRWPGGRHVAVVLNIAYEAWSETATSGIGPMGNPLPAGVFDHNAESYGNYGAQAGIRRLMRMLDRAKAHANVFTSGALALRAPQQVRAIAGTGHEIVAHGFTQDMIPSTLTARQDEAAIAQTTEELSRVIGQHPGGWISPRATSGEDTTRRLIQHGYRWHGDALDADLPYLQHFPEGDITAIPLSYEFNDLAHSMRFGRTPQQFVESFEQSLMHALADKGDTVILDVLVHTHCYGRPACAWAYGAIANLCVLRDDIWLTTRGRIADHFLASLDGKKPSPAPALPLKGKA